jgi:hypothetical protein
VLAVAVPRLPRWPRAVAIAALALAASASLRWPAYHFVVLAHLHNVVPLVFLWEWARRLPTAAARAGFRIAQVGWVLVIPLLILAGLADAWTGRVAPGVAAFAGRPAPAAVLAVSAPPSTVDAAMGVRFLVVFAFLQTMHYAVGVWFLPRYAPDATAAFERRVPALTGRRVWALGIAGGALLAVLFGLDYASGRSVYSALATYHAYLEFPVLLALIVGRPPVLLELPTPPLGVQPLLNGAARGPGGPARGWVGCDGGGDQRDQPGLGGAPVP